jgi:hypothetical protein
MQVVSIINPSIIEATIKAFDKSQTKIEEATRKATETEDKAIQKTLDAMTIACDKPKAEFMKGNAVKNPARAQIKGLFDALAEKGFISKASASVYQSCFWMAFEKGIPFSRTLAKDASDAKAATKDTASDTPKAKAKATSSGKIETTNTEALHKTLSKAIKQARLLGEDDFAAAILDSCIAKWESFKEIE